MRGAWGAREAAEVRVVREAAGVVIATPEFNYSIPGPLKNALDWLSRPGFKSVFAGKHATRGDDGGLAEAGSRERVAALVQAFEATLPTSVRHAPQ